MRHRVPYLINPQQIPPQGNPLFSRTLADIVGDFLTSPGQGRD
jgi:hypothetical protein